LSANPKYLTTCSQENRYRLEEIGIAGLSLHNMLFKEGGRFLSVPRLPVWSFLVTYQRGSPPEADKFCPLRIFLAIKLGAAASPIYKLRKDSALSPVTSRKVLPLFYSAGLLFILLININFELTAMSYQLIFSAGVISIISMPESKRRAAVTPGPHPVPVSQ